MKSILEQRRVIVGMCLACGVMLSASSVSAQGLDVVMSCPDYEPGPPARGNDPGQGLAIQPGTVLYDVGERLSCTIYYSHTGHAPLQGVTMRLRSPVRPARVLVSDPAVLPDGNPYDAVMGQPGVFAVSDMMTDAIVSASGLGAYDASTGDYTWSLGQVWPGSVGRLEVSWVANPGPSGAERVWLDVSDGAGALMVPREVQIAYRGDTTIYAGHGVFPPRVDPETGHIGAKHIWRRQRQGRPHTDGVVVVNLPYWDGTDVRADGGFDPFDPLHEAIFDVDELEARVVLDRDTVIGTLEPGLRKGP